MKPDWAQGKKYLIENRLKVNYWKQQVNSVHANKIYESQAQKDQKLICMKHWKMQKKAG